jgi:hypothetical protein
MERINSLLNGKPVLNLSIIEAGEDLEVNLEKKKKKSWL